MSVPDYRCPRFFARVAAVNDHLSLPIEQALRFHATVFGRPLLLAMREYLLVGCLRKIVIPHTDRVERLRCEGTNRFVGVGP